MMHPNDRMSAATRSACVASAAHGSVSGDGGWIRPGTYTADLGAAAAAAAAPPGRKERSFGHGTPGGAGEIATGSAAATSSGGTLPSPFAVRARGSGGGVGGASGSDAAAAVVSAPHPLSCLSSCPLLSPAPSCLRRAALRRFCCRTSKYTGVRFRFADELHSEPALLLLPLPLSSPMGNQASACACVTGVNAPAGLPRKNSATQGEPNATAVAAAGGEPEVVLVVAAAASRQLRTL